MRVYLIAAPEDRETGEALAAFLKQYGVSIRSDYGELAYPPAQHGEMTLALWSRAAMMSTRQMMLTNRAIDAWSEGLLVMARLEHGLNPRGLADLDMIDLTFPAIREQRFRDVLNALRRLDDTRHGRLQPRGSSRVAGIGSAPRPEGGLAEAVDEAPELRMKRLLEQSRAVRNEIEDRGAANAADPLEAAAKKRALGREMRADRPLTANRMARDERALAKSSSAGGLVRFVLLLVLAIALAWAIWSGQVTWQRGAIIGAVGLALLVIVSGLAAVLLASPSPKSSRHESPSSARANKEASRPAFGVRPAGIEGGAVDAPVPALDLPPRPAAEPDPDIFVSYAHQNAETVLPIVSKVEAAGLKVWIDREEIRAGELWAGMIVRAIKASGRFCLMCSEAAFASNHVRREVYLADKYGKDMLPIRLDTSEMPEDIEYFLIGRQWVDLTGLSDEDKFAALRAVLGANAQTT